MQFVDFFAGIGGVRLGLERAGHKCIGFCEFDRFARQAYKAMYDTEKEWEAHDIRTISSSDVPKADLWTFGFPCQDLSVAGKRKGLQEGERSGLFYEIIRLLSGLRQEDRPQWILAENVKGLFSAGRGFDFLRCVLELGRLGYNIEYQLLNSKNFGVPQNRERVFIVGHFGERSGRKVFPLTSSDEQNTGTSEEVRPVSLFNIYGRGKGTGFAGNVYDKKAISPTLNTMGGGNRQPMILDVEPKVIDAIYNHREPRITDFAPTLRADRQGLCVTEKGIKVLGNYMPSGSQSGRIVSTDGIAPTVMENHGSVTCIAVDLTENSPKLTDNVRCLKARYTAGITNFSGDNSGILVTNDICNNVFDVYNNKMREDGCTGTITAHGNASSTASGTFGVLVKPVLTPDREEKRQNGRRMKEDGEPMFTLTAQDRHGVAMIGGLQEHQKVRTDGLSPCLTQAMGMGGGQTPCVLGTRIRKLTPRECWRLQGFPDEYFDRAVAAGVSNSQLYKQAGNAVTVNVAEAIGHQLKLIELEGEINDE